MEGSSSLPAAGGTTSETSCCTKWFCCHKVLLSDFTKEWVPMASEPEGGGASGVRQAALLPDIHNNWRKMTFETFRRRIHGIPRVEEREGSDANEFAPVPIGTGSPVDNRVAMPGLSSAHDIFYGAITNQVGSERMNKTSGMPPHPRLLPLTWRPEEYANTGLNFGSDGNPSNMIGSNEARKTMSMFQVKEEIESEDEDSDSGPPVLAHFSEPFPDQVTRSRYGSRHRTETYKCSTCGKSFSKLISLQIHEQEHRLGDLKPFYCEECKHSYTTKGSFDRHIKRHRKCGACGIQLPNASICKAVAAEEEMAILCNDCKKSTGQRLMVGRQPPVLVVRKRPSKTGRGQPESKSDVHSESNSTEDDENADEDYNGGKHSKHNRKCASDKYMLCKLCGKKFMQKSRYQYHLKCHKRKSTNPYKCKECGETFGAANGLRNHEVKHIKQPLFECDVCHRKYRKPHHLKHHRTTHFKSSEFACQLCGREFGSLCSLRTHETKARHDDDGFSQARRS